MILQYGYWCQLNHNLFCNNDNILAIYVNAVATHFVVITNVLHFAPLLQIRWKQTYVITLFVVTGQNIVINTNWD